VTTDGVAQALKMRAKMVSDLLALEEMLEGQIRFDPRNRHCQSGLEDPSGGVTIDAPWAMAQDKAITVEGRFGWMKDQTQRLHQRGPADLFHHTKISPTLTHQATQEQNL